MASLVCFSGPPSSAGTRGSTGGDVTLSLRGGRRKLAWLSPNPLPGKSISIEGRWSFCMQSQNLVKQGILVADNSLLSAGKNKRNFRKAEISVAAMLSPSYLKAPPYFVFESGEQWTVTVRLHWCQAHCIRQEFSPICLSLSQYYLAYFILAAETAVMVQAQTTQKNNMLGNICLHTPRACARWKNRAYIS